MSKLFRNWGKSVVRFESGTGILLEGLPTDGSGVHPNSPCTRILTTKKLVAGRGNRTVDGKSIAMATAWPDRPSGPIILRRKTGAFDGLPLPLCEDHRIDEVCLVLCAGEPHPLAIRGVLTNIGTGARARTTIKTDYEWPDHALGAPVIQGNGLVVGIVTELVEENDQRVPRVWLVNQSDLESEHPLTPDPLREALRNHVGEVWRELDEEAENAEACVDNLLESGCNEAVRRVKHTFEQLDDRSTKEHLFQIARALIAYRADPGVIELKGGIYYVNTDHRSILAMAHARIAGAPVDIEPCAKYDEDPPGKHVVAWTPEKDPTLTYAEHCHETLRSHQKLGRSATPALLRNVTLDRKVERNENVYLEIRPPTSAHSFSEEDLEELAEVAETYHFVNILAADSKGDEPYYRLKDDFLTMAAGLTTSTEDSRPPDPTQ